MTPGKAELILQGGRIWDQRQLEADSVAIAEGRILAVGPAAELGSLEAEDTIVIDVGGKRVMPALIDSHMHLIRAGSTWSRDVDWQGLTSLEDGLEAIDQSAARSNSGTWVAVLGGWHHNQFAERRPPTTEELDEAAPQNPVFVQRNYIEAFLNRHALAAMGWNGPSLPDGVELDANGDPTGRVRGPGLLAALRAKLAVPGHEQQVESTRRLLRKLNSFGLGGAIDTAGFGMSASSYEAFLDVYRRGERGFRTRMLLGPATPGNEREEIGSWLERVRPGQGDDFLRYLGAGEVLLYSAHDMEGLDDRDVSAERAGLEAITRTLAGDGWPAHVHAILDRSISTVLDAWRAVGAERLAPLRYTITHAEGISDATIGRVAEMGLGVTIQNGMAFRGGDSRESWSPSTAASAPPLRSMLEAGIPLGAGTDAGVVSSFNPWLCIWWMVTGDSVDGSPPRVEQERLDIDEALRLYTRGSAWFSFEEGERGNLAPGSLADITVLASDPLSVRVDELRHVTADLTIIGGVLVHDSGGTHRPR